MMTAPSPAPRTQCPFCFRYVRNRPHGGSTRLFAHRCPHGEWCVSGRDKFLSHIKSPHCPQCANVHSGLNQVAQEVAR